MSPVDELPASYAAVHRYNGAVLHRDRRAEIVPMAIQPRDFAIVLDVWRYKFLTVPMVHELHWNRESSMWPAQRRLQKLFHAGLLERFRPVSLRGSYPWTCHLGERGHVVLRDSQVVDTGWRYRPRVVHEFTRRVDKDFEKFRRYDTFLVWWWNRMPEALHAPEPYVVFICQDEDQLDQFMPAADHELNGHHDCLDYNRDRFVGRNRILFAVEQDMHAGRLDAWRVPAVPRNHPNREKHSDMRSVALTVGS